MAAKARSIRKTPQHILLKQGRLWNLNSTFHRCFINKGLPDSESAATTLYPLCAILSHPIHQLPSRYDLIYQQRYA